jgi:hypothetical protein
MNEKEKAKKIYNEMLYHIEYDFGSDNRHSHVVAKACAFNAVKEVLNVLNSDDIYIQGENNILEEIDYWQRVLSEVQSL